MPTQTSRFFQFIMFSMTIVSLLFTLPLKSSAQQKVAYLTFDDGPSQLYTPQILKELKQSHVKSTFFVLGFRCELFPAIVRRIHLDGHEIGNHGYYHQFIVHQTDEFVKSDVKKTDTAVFNACGVRPLFYRPPGGKIEINEVKVVQSMGHPIKLWTVDSKDWKANSTQFIIKNVEEHIRPGAIILFHDGVSNSRYTVQALPKIIKDLKNQGYIFKTL